MLGQLESYRFEGGENMNITLAAAAVVDLTSSYDPSVYPEGVVRLTTSASHAFLVGDSPKYPNHVMITGTDNYNGLRKIVAVSAAQLDIGAKFVAETTSTGDKARPGLSFDGRWYFEGYKLHVDAAPSTAGENLIISIDAAAGANFDINHVTTDMNTLTDVEEFFEEPIHVNADDVLYCEWANVDSGNWGLELLGRRLM